MVTKSAKRVTGFLGTSALTRPLFMLGAASALLGAGPAQALDGNTLPQNPNVVGGKDTFQQSGNTLNVNQSTNRTVIDWRSFDIGSKAQVNFNQPGTSAIAVNRVNSSANPTQIEGGLHANGQVWILNPNGVFFGKGARVDAAGIVASTANIDTKAFMGGSNKLQMTGADHGAVENQGNITVGANGLAAFVAPSVRNSGTINATVGRVALAAGTTYTLDLAGDHLVELGLGSVKAVVDNSGKIVNPGGTIALTAKAAGQVVNSVVNVSGVVSASSVSKSGGSIVLGADTINTTSTAQLSADAGTNGNGGAITSVANVQGNYAGSFSAQGGSKSGDGGKIETSGKSVSVASAANINASASHGVAGTWLVDPLDVTISTGLNNNTMTGSAVTTGTIEHALSTGTSVDITTSQSGSGLGDLSLAGSINVAAINGADLTLEGRHLSATSGSQINISGAGSSLILDVNTVNNTANPSGNWIADALGMVGTVTGGTTINLGSGTYAAGATINRSDVTLNGNNVAKIAVGTGQTGISIGSSSNNVTIEGLEFDGSVTTPYYSTNWALAANAGITAISIGGNTAGGANNFNINNNTIQNVRTGILIAGNIASGSVTNNKIENTKGGVLINYNNGAGYTISGNSEGPIGNEWGIVLDLNDTAHWNTGTASLTWQAALLNLAKTNGNMAVMDRDFAFGNRTRVTVDDDSTATAADDNNLGNGLGNARQPLTTIQQGLDAVVSGGTINVLDGMYVVSATNGYAHGGSIWIDKSVNLIGQSEGGVIIDARGASTYGMRITATDGPVSLSNFTIWGAVNGQAGKTDGLGNSGYGIKAEATNGLSISNVTSQGAFKTELDLNGVVNATISNFDANGMTVGGTSITGGNGVAITDSQNVVLTGVHTENNNWGGLAFYQHDDYGLSDSNITVGSSNHFTEANGIYAEDQSATLDFGTIDLSGQGITYIAQNLAGPNDFYTWFRTGEQAAIETAAAAGPTTAYVQGYAGNVTGDNHFVVGTSAGGTAMSISAAVNAAAADATIDVLAGTYVISNQLVINKDLTITGDANSRATIKAGADFSGSGAAGAWMLVNSGIDFDLSNVIIDGTGHQINQALRSQGNTTIDNVAFRNIAVSASGQPYDGVAIESFGGTVVGGVGSDTNGAGGSASHLTVTNSTFDNIGREGILVKGTGATADIIGNTYTGKGVGDWLDYGIEVGAGGQATITGNTITGALGVASVDGSTSAGIMVTTYYGAGSRATIQNNKVTGNTVAVDVGFDSNDTSVVNASNNNFAGNGVELESSLSTANFSGNWWGTTDATAISNLMTGASASLVDFSPYLMSGTDTSSAVGFQGNFSNLTVTTLGGGDSARIQEGIADVTAGGTVNMTAGNYTLAGQLDITKSLTLTGATTGTTNITSNSTGYGINVTADNVSLKNFTYHGPTAVGSTYGIKVTPDTNVASDRLLNFDIENVTIDRGYRTGLDLNGVLGATIKNVSVSNIVNGNGIALTDSANVTITDSSTAHNAWGGLALYQHNNFYDQRINNVVVNGSNNFSEANSIYAEDQSNSLDMGSVTLAGYTYILQSPNDPHDVYTWFQKTAQGAIDLATNLVANGGNVNLPTAYVEGWDGSSGNNIFTVGYNTADTQALSIQAAINAAAANATINVGAGTYTDALNIGKNVDIEGAGAGSTIIQPTALLTTGVGHKYDADVKTAVYVHDASDVTINGVTIDANNLGANAVVFWNNASGTISNAVIENPMAFSGAQTGQGIAVDATGSNTTNLTVDNVTFQNWNKNAIDAVNGDGASANGGTINLTVSDSDFIGHGDTGTIAQNGILVWEQGGGTINATVDGSSFSGLSYNDPNTATATGVLVYGTTNGTVTVSNSTFDSSVQEYISTAGGSTNEVDATTGNIFGGVAMSSATLDQIFAIEDKITDGMDDTANGIVRLKAGNVYVTSSNVVADGVTQAAAGNTVNVQSGTYAENISTGKQLSFNFEDVTLNSLTLGSASTLSGDLTTTGAIALNGNTTVNGDLTAASFTANATLAMVGDLDVSGAAALNGASTIAGDVSANTFTANGTLALVGDLSTSGAAALNGAASITGDVTADSLATGNTFTLAGDLVAANGVTLGGASSITGDVTADSLATGNTFTLVGDLVAANGVTLGGASTITGDVSAKTFTANGTLALNGNLAATGAALFNGASSVNGNLNAASITANDAFTLNGNAVASGAIALNGATTLAGNLTGGSIALGATTLTGNTTLNTSAANGAIKVASVNGSTAGGQSLAIKAGTGSVSLGNVGATTRLGAVSDASKTTLTGSTYNANSFLFGGAVTLTAATTTLNTTQSSTAAGDITFQGDLFGTTDGGQSLTLIAGPGTGAASANGDITLQNAGTTTVNLNNMTVSGDNFTALTVDLAGNYNSVLTGNQVFAADTLNVKGNATSTVGGDASGHVVAGGDVSFAAQGDVSGTISGQNVKLTGDDVNANVNATDTATITGSTVEGSYTADTVSLTASNNVDAAVNATNFTLAAQNGSVDGTWTTINTDGSGVVNVNGQPTVGLANINPSQLVVEGFVLPNGTIIGANGELILPQGVLLGLLSPGGGKPKMILVHTVHQLGELLASGYSVIVIDLSNRDSGKPIQLASN